MDDSVRVLCVGDESLELLVGAIEDADGRLDVGTASAAQTRDILEADEERFDCLVGTAPSGSDIAEWCSTIRDVDPTLAVVYVAEADGTDDTVDGPVTADDAIAAGVTEYVQLEELRTSPALVRKRIENAVAVTRHDSAQLGHDDGAAVAFELEGDVAEGVAAESDAAEGDAGEDLERYRTIVESVGDPMYLLDEHGRFVYVNEAMVETFDRDPEAYEGSSITEFMHEDDYEKAIETVRSLLRSGDRQATVEWSMPTGDGDERVGETSLTVLTDDGGYAGSVGVIRDVTERKARERQLGLYETILETAPIGMFAVDPDGVIIWCNERLAQGFEWTVDEFVGKYFAELVSTGYIEALTIEEYADYVRHLLSSSNDDEKVTFELVWNDVSGEHHITEVHMGLLPLEDGEFAGTVYAFRRITERKRYEAELERQNERLENFASFVSHDLRNPLNVADGYLGLLQAVYDDPNLDEVEWALDRIEELIDDLLTLAREGEAVADPVPFSPAEVAEDAWAAVDTGDATLEVDIEADSQFLGDPGRVTNLFENLFRNCLEHGLDPERDEALTVRVGSLSRQGARKGMPLPPEASGFYVEDDGRGLPDDADVFESGFTTNEEGTGLGLAIVSEIVDAHGWEIGACDGDDGGARFEVTDVSMPVANRSN